jgi:hypothetical protein
MVLRKHCLTILLLTFISCSGQSNWDNYTDDKGHFKIEFKSKPTVKTEPQQFQFANVTWTTIAVEKPDKSNLSYLVKYADFPASIITT